MSNSLSDRSSPSSVCEDVHPSFLRARDPSEDRCFRPRPDRQVQLFDDEEGQTENSDEDISSSSDELSTPPSEASSDLSTNAALIYLRVKPVSDVSTSYTITSAGNVLVAAPPSDTKSTSNNNKKMEKHFSFSAVFDGRSRQDEVYRICIAPRIESGDSFTVLTYGTSGSGKTFTLLGTPSNPGIVPRAVENLFKMNENNIYETPAFKLEKANACILDDDALEREKSLRNTLLDACAGLNDDHDLLAKTIKAEHDFQAMEQQGVSVFIWISFIEIYNELVCDLLAPPQVQSKAKQRMAPTPRKSLKIFINDGKVFIQGLTSVYVKSSDETLKLLHWGLQRATYASTSLNDNSSRSHCVFIIDVIKYYNSDVTVETYKFCDLAGSERLTNTCSIESRLTEAKKINQSLLTLGRCLDVANKNHKLKTKELIPVRESKLTMVLRAALLGREKLTMIVNVTPTDALYEENMNVLRYSAIAKNIIFKQPTQPVNKSRYSFVVQNAKSEAEEIIFLERALRNELSETLSEKKSEVERLNSEMKKERALRKELVEALAEKRSLERALRNELSETLSEKKSEVERLNSEMKKERALRKELVEALAEKRSLERALRNELSETLSEKKSEVERLNSEMKKERALRKELVEALAEKEKLLAETNTKLGHAVRRAEQYEAELREYQKRGVADRSTSVAATTESHASSITGGSSISIKISEASDCESSTGVGNQPTDVPATAADLQSSSTPRITISTTSSTGGAVAISSPANNDALNADIYLTPTTYAGRDSNGDAAAEAEVSYAEFLDVLKIYRNSVKRSFATTFAEELFQNGLIPSDTDFRIFRDFGKVPGLDLAHNYNGYVYHTKFDRSEIIPIGTLQTTGDNILAMARAFVNSTELEDPSLYANGKVVFYDVLSYFVVYYTESTAKMLNIGISAVALVLVATTLCYIASNSFVSIGHILRLFGLIVVLHLIGLILAIGLPVLIAVIYDSVNLSLTWFTSKWMVYGLYVSPALFGLASPTLLYLSLSRNDKVTHSYRLQMVGHAHTLVMSVLCIGLTLMGIRSTYFAMISLLFYAGSMLMNLLTTLYRRAYYWSIFVILGQVMPFLYFSYLFNALISSFMPMMGRFGSGSNPDLIIAAINILASLLTFGYLIQLLNIFSRPNLVILFLPIVTVIFVGISLTSIGFPYRPKTNVQRINLIESHRVFYEYDGSVSRNESGYYFDWQDRRRHLPLASTVDLTGLYSTSADCDVYLACGLPIYNHRSSKVSKLSSWLPREQMLKLPGASHLTLLNKTISDNRKSIRFEYELAGPSHMGIFIEPYEDVTVSDWSFITDMLENRDTNPPPYHIYFSYGKLNTPLKFYIDLEKDNGQFDVPLMQLAIVAHYIDEEYERDEETKKFLASLPAYTYAMEWPGSYKRFIF